MKEFNVHAFFSLEWLHYMKELMPMRSFLEKNVQIILNRYLALDPESIHRLNALKGHRITIELNGLGLVFQLIFTESTLLIKTNDFDKADTLIKGTPLSLLHMTFTSGDRKKFFAEDVIIEGNLECGQQVIELFDTLEIDWEEYLSRITGDVPAHQIFRAVSHLKNVTTRLQKTLTQTLNEYVHEEKNLFPPPEALHDFFQEVDDLCMHTDRLEERTARLYKKLAAKRGLA
jgi:ubiquinone biosynthesis accessory factor UbiJ